MKIVRIHPDERMDIPDMQAISGELELFDAMRIGRTVVMTEGETTGLAATEARVFDGFDISNIVGGTCQVNRGVALFKLVEEGVTYSFLTFGDDGDVAKALDLSAEANGNYNVYVRPVYIDGENENRVHWNAGGAPAAEYVDNVTTRRVLSWEVSYTSGAAPAGDSWVQIAILTVAAAAITVYTDYRHLYFEGDMGPGVGNFGYGAAEWGTANDRNADRGTYGLKTWWEFASAFRQKMLDIQGPSTGWFVAPDPTLEDLAVEHHTDGQHLDINATSIALDQRTGGATDTEWDIITLKHPAPAEHRINFTADDQATDGSARIVMDDSSAYARYDQNPRGIESALTNGDYGELCALGPDDTTLKHGLRSTAIDIVAGQYQHDIGELVGTPPLSIWQGYGAGRDGSYLTETGARYFHTNRTEWIVPQFEFRPMGSNWIGSNSIPFPYTCPAGNAGDVSILRTSDWPEGMTLNTISIKLQLAVAANPATPLQIVAYLITWQSGATAPTTAVIGVGLSKTTTTREDLTISPAVSSITHETQEIVLLLIAADTASTVYAEPRFNVTYSTVSKWAQ